MNSELIVKKLHPAAILPTRGSPDAIGLDLYSVEGLIIGAGERAVVGTGLAMIIPPGTYGRVAPRSGLAVKNGIDVGAGVIDRDYRGEIGVVLFNLSKHDFTINVGQRIAQLILEKACMADVKEVDSFDINTSTTRGTCGFGSSGK